MKPTQEEKVRGDRTIRIEEDCMDIERVLVPKTTDTKRLSQRPGMGASVEIAEDTDAQAAFHPMMEPVVQETAAWKAAGAATETARSRPVESRRRDIPKTVEPGTGKRVAWILASAILFFSAAVACTYLYASRQYRTVFFPNTVINGIDASGKRVDQVKALIQSGMSGYKLTLLTRDGTSETIWGNDINLHAEYDGTLEKLLAGQKPLKWGSHYLKGTSHTISTMIASDKERLEQVLKTLKCMDMAAADAPEDAYLSDYITGSGYQIVPEKQGNRLLYDKVLSGVTEATMNLRTELSLEELKAYEEPRITSDNPELNAKAGQWNRLAGVTVTYQFGDAAEVLDGSLIHTWLSENEYGNPLLDEEQVAAYIKGLADKYNTAYKEKNLKTSYGPTVTINKGNYGWRINQSAETAALSEIIRSGTGQTREPIYSQTAASHGSQDYGNTYVEINLTAQHLYFYKNGSLLVEADFVSGNEKKGWSTPSGAYPLTYKQRNATLRGEGYATPVSYWMPFNGGIGMHDANWRSGFGGAIYKTGGSHGCINLPPAKAKIIYENISSGIPVLCYHLEGTQKDSPAAVPPAATAPSVPAKMPILPAEYPVVPEETPAEQPSIPAEQPSTPAETPNTPVTPNEPVTVPAKTPEAAPPENYGPGGAPAKPDTGAVAGPGM